MTPRQDEAKRKRDRSDVTGRVFGRLTVVSVYRKKKLGGSTTYCLCRCECGREKLILRDALVRGATNSCGCLLAEHHSVNEDSIGFRFGRLTVIDIRKRKRNDADRVQWLMRCDCGKERWRRPGMVKRGYSKSCGCLQREQFIQRVTIHGGFGSTEYRAWTGMKARCYDHSTPAYKYYGAKGVTVCDRWKNSFENFFADMGYRPADKQSLDRINPFGNYEPSNCRWATHKEQANNRRSHAVKRMLHGASL